MASFQQIDAIMFTLNAQYSVVHLSFSCDVM